jgi:RimJ/RimL family protein N-acetyltransferase
MSSAERRIETERLVLRHWRDADLDGFAAMNGDPEVMRFIGDGHVQDRAEAANLLDRIRRGWTERGFGRWAIQRRSDGVFAGFCGVGFLESFPEVADEPEIGWRLPRALWGAGYATEAAIASRDDFFRTTAYDHLISLSHPGNVASERIMAKLGMRRVEDVRHPTIGAIVHRHRLDRADWTAA